MDDEAADDWALPPHELEALRSGACLVIDMALDELRSGVWNDEPERSFITSYLPPQTLINNPYGAYKDFLLAAIVVADRLQDPLWMSRPNCLIETFALNAVIQFGDAVLENEGHEPSEHYAALDEVLFEDWDHRFMFEPEMDGIDEDPILRTEPLKRSAWGTGYYGRRAHPMYETPRVDGQSKAEE